MMSNYAIAIVENLGSEATGFEWGTKRKHRLLRLPMIDGLDGALNCEAYKAEKFVARAIADKIAYKMDLDVKSIAVVEIDKGVTAEWPSAGHSESWPDYVLNGVADYLSYREFCRMLGKGTTDYTLEDDVADSCVRRSGIGDVREALAYLTPADSIYGTLSRAIERAESKSPAAV